jgi:fructose-bisphosphate aldolase class II
VQYSRTGDWRVGLELFLADLGVLAGPGSPFAELRVMVHLDHVQPGTDAELLDSGLGRFSSIMFDASGLPAGENIELTRRFVERRGREIVIEGACDRIAEAGEDRPDPPEPAEVERYAARTGVDMVVADLGTEHRAGAAERRYRGELARGISRRIGPRLVLHGCSSVPPGELAGLFADGVCKANIWTMLERDSSPALLAAMVRHSSRVAGPVAARALAEEGFLGPSAELSAGPDLEHFTTAHRQGIVFERMREMVGDLLRLWYG